MAVNVPKTSLSSNTQVAPFRPGKSPSLSRVQILQSNKHVVSAVSGRVISWILALFFLKSLIKWSELSKGVGNFYSLVACLCNLWLVYLDQSSLCLCNGFDDHQWFICTLHHIGYHWVVVANSFSFHPYLEKWSNLTNIFQWGWNHQLHRLSECTIDAEWCHLRLKNSILSTTLPGFCPSPVAGRAGWWVWALGIRCRNCRRSDWPFPCCASPLQNFANWSGGYQQTEMTWRVNYRAGDMALLTVDLIFTWNCHCYDIYIYYHWL